jgi:hypothetical protein
MSGARSRFLQATALCSPLLLGLPAMADEGAKWSAHLEVGGKVGTKTAIGETSLFVPLFQTFDRLIYTDIRGAFGKQGSQELNAGLGIRQIIDNRWILGAYGFFDYRRSQYNNHFKQITLGAEAMTESLTLRANAYLPVGKTRQTLASHDSVAVGSGAITVREGQERAMRGFDAEAGALLKGLQLTADGKDQFWIYGGGYAFWEDRTETVWGPRVRAEYRIDDVLFEGSRVSLLAEYQYDEPRGNQGFFGARLRLPLQRVFGVNGGSNLTPLEMRMTETVVRDVDVVTQAGAFGDAVTGIDAATGTALDNLEILDASSATLEQDIETAGAAKQIFVYGAGERIDVSGTISLTASQRVAGAFNVRNPLTGRTMRVGDTRINGTSTTTDIFEMAEGARLTGFTLSGGRTAVNADGANNVTLADLTITDVGSGGINVENASNLTISGVRFSNVSFSGADGFSNFNPTSTVKGVAIRLNRVDGATISDVTADTVGMGVFANVSENLVLTNVNLSNTSKEAVVFHYVHNAELDGVNIERTGADGVAFVASGDIAYRNSSLTGLGAVTNAGKRSGINISGFSGDGSIIVGSESNKGYAFENLVIAGATNSGMMVQEVRDSSFRNIAISDVDLIGIQLMQMLNASQNLEFENVTIDKAGNAGFWMMGAFSNLNGGITTTGTDVPCGRSPYMATSLNQAAGNVFSVNGTAIDGANVSTACVEASNF